MDSQPTQSSKPSSKIHSESQSRAKWTIMLTRILVDLLVDQVHKGNRQNKSFSKNGWRLLCDEFCKATGLNWDMDQLKSRYSALRKHYLVTKSVLNQDGFKWDEPTGVIVATDEAWDTYIKEHPDAETVRSSGCPMYKQLCMIFSGPPETNGSVPCPQPLSMFEQEEVKPMIDSDETADISFEAQERIQSTAVASKENGSRKRGRKGIDDAIANAMREMAAASKLRAEAISKYNKRFSIADCVKALDEMQGVDEGDYFAALDLFNNRNARETFLSLKSDKRLIWLQGKCSFLTHPKINSAFTI